VGIGRRNVVELGDRKLEEEGRLVCFDLVKLERRLKENLEKGRGSIVATSFGEVNTGCVVVSPSSAAAFLFFPFLYDAHTPSRLQCHQLRYTCSPHPLRPLPRLATC
jgi:hypothetical protein